MRNAVVGAALVATLCLVPRSHAADDATLLRVFLKDGTSLVSYGEPARVGDRVVFSMPTAATPNPPLQLVNLAAGRVDWDRTNRYAAAARSAHYFQNQADIDYAALSGEIAQALNEVTQTSDSARRLAIAEAARKRLSEWPPPDRWRPFRFSWCLASVRARGLALARSSIRAALLRAFRRPGGYL